MRSKISKLKALLISDTASPICSSGVNALACLTSISAASIFLDFVFAKLAKDSYCCKSFLFNEV